MSAVGVTIGRTLSRARSMYTTAFATAAFLAAAAVRFAFGIDAAEGTRATVVATWADSVAPFLPVLAAFYAMDLWSEERRSGRADMLLSVAVRERELVIGKFFGSWIMLASATALSLACAAASLVAFAPDALDWTRMSDFLPALLILLLAVVILAVFTVITLLIMNALTRPLLRLTSASQRLAAGDYAVELDYEGRDEVGILTRSFRQMRDQLKLHINDLSAKAYTDAMTGVRNKGAFDAYLARLDDAMRAEEPERKGAFAIVMFDCNRLKQINDQHGHSAGDTYLQRTCKLICHVYAHSPVFRLGGDEFAVVLQGGDYENRDALLSEFERLSKERNATADQPWDAVDVSKGMAVFDPDVDRSAAQVLERADRLMYEAKRQGKSE